VSRSDWLAAGLVTLVLVVLVAVDGPAVVGPFAQIGAFLLAFWLALRTLAGERPRLHIYESNILDLQYDLRAAMIGALVEVKLINLARAANAVALTEVVLTRGDVDFRADDGAWYRESGVIRLEVGPGLKWSVAAPEPTSLPFTIPALEASRLFLFVTVPATFTTRPGLFGADEWTAIGARPSTFEPRELRSYVYVTDVYGRTYEQKDELAGAEWSWIRITAFRLRWAVRRRLSRLRIFAAIQFKRLRRRSSP